jgi:hypothetical protein
MLWAQVGPRSSLLTNVTRCYLWPLSEGISAHKHAVRAPPWTIARQFLRLRHATQPPVKSKGHSRCELISSQGAGEATLESLGEYSAAACALRPAHGVLALHPTREPLGRKGVGEPRAQHRFETGLVSGRFFSLSCRRSCMSIVHASQTELSVHNRERPYTCAVLTAILQMLLEIA